jgi:hypothetical protein
VRGVGPIHASQNEVPQQGMSAASRKSAEHSGHFRSSGMSIADRLWLPICAAVSARNCALRTRRQRSVCQNKQTHTEGHRTASWFGGARSDLTTGPCAEWCAKSNLRAGRCERTRQDRHAVQELSSQRTRWMPSQRGLHPGESAPQQRHPTVLACGSGKLLEGPWRAWAWAAGHTLGRHSWGNPSLRDLQTSGTAAKWDSG